MSLASQPATRAGGPRPDDSDEEDDGPPGDLYQPSHFQDTQCGDLAQPSHFGTGESLAELSARMSQLESVSRRNTRGSMESAASTMRSGPTTASTMRAAAARAAAKKRSNPPTPKPPTPPPELPPEPPTPAPPPDQDVPWVDKLGSFRDEKARTPRAFSRDPVSVGVVRRQSRQRRRREERAEKARLRKPRPVQPRRDSSSEEEPEAPLVHDPPDAKKLYNLSFGDVVEGTSRREALVKSIEDELRDGGTVLLVADPSENENDEASCRAVLRTLHMALHPKLRDPIPPLPLKRADGAFGMTLRAPPSRVPAAPF